MRNCASPWAGAQRKKTSRTQASRLQLATAIVNDAHRRGESLLDGAGADSKASQGLLTPAANYGVDVDVELGVFGQPLELLVEDLQAFFETSSGLTLSMEICR